MTDITSDEKLLADLGVEVKSKPKSKLSPKEIRIISGFEEIERFVEENGRSPQHGEDREIFERIYAVRLDAIRNSKDCLRLLKERDSLGLLDGADESQISEVAKIDDQELLEDLGVSLEDDSNISNLKNVRTRSEINAAEEVARRTPCKDFKKYKVLFEKVQSDLEAGIRQTREFKNYAKMKAGDFFILGGQKLFVAQMGEEFVNDYERPDRRLLVIYDNGTESNILLRSLQRALNKDEAGRRITDPDMDGPLFTGIAEEADTASGKVYVLRSKSENQVVDQNRNIIHKIGVTSGNINKRIANAKLDPTFLMADVEVVATYELSNISRFKLEKVIHDFFEAARLDIEIKDRFGKPVVPREWFLVPMFVIDEAIERIKDGTIVNCKYDVKTGKIVED